MFNADGAIGGTAQKVGGPLAKDGVVGFVSAFVPSLFAFLCAVENKSKPSGAVVNGSRGREKSAEYYWIERLLDEFPNIV